MSGRKIAISFAAAMIGVMAGGANAEPSGQWTGFYLSLLGGKTFATHETRGDEEAYDEPLLEVYKLKPKSWIGGFQVGYNEQFDYSVLGIEAGLFYGKDTDSFRHLSTDDPLYDNFGRVTLGMHGTVTARLGYDMGSVLPYLKGGLAWGHFKMETGDLDGIYYDPTDYTSKKGLHVGWTIGGGVEYAINEMFSIKAEYLYMDLGKYKTSNEDGDIFRHKVDMHSLRIGLSVRF